MPDGDGEPGSHVMTDLRESWERTRAHLLRAASVAGAQHLETFEGYLDHNELALAADVLEDLGNERGDLPRPFWEALASAYENMQEGASVTRCRFRIQEIEHGFVEAQLTLSPTSAGGRSTPILTDYRPDWNLGTRTASGEPLLTGATVALEDARAIAPGGSGLVRLHPRLPEAWHALQPGAEIAIQEGSRIVGKAIVLHVTLASGRDEPV
jgi:hypothetical protein